MKAKRPPLNPVQPPDRVAFLARIRHWQKRLTLTDWRIELAIKPAPRHAAALLDKCLLPDRLATIRLGGDFGSMAVNAATLDEFALHETAHVWLAEFRNVCQDPRSTEDDISAAEHRLVNSLVHCLLDR